MRTMSLFVPLALVACAAPGPELRPAADDFAFVEVRLRG
jgi:hypothetical protein